MGFLSLAHDAPLRGYVSAGLPSANHEEAMTASNCETEADMEHLEESKTCDDGCCDHSCGCNCGSCFCQVRTDIKKNPNQTTYSGEGGNGTAIGFNHRNHGANHDPCVQALAVNMASRCTDCGSLPINKSPLSFDALRQRDAYQSYEEHMRLNVQRLGIHVGIDDDHMSDDERPDQDFVSPIAPQSDCELELFVFESHELSPVTTHEMPPSALGRDPRGSSRNASIAYRGAGGQFDAASAANRSEYSLNLSLCFYPLVVVPECRHAYSAADCA